MEFSYVDGRNIKWYKHFRKIGWWFPKQVNILLPHDVAFIFLNILPKRNESICPCEDICPRKFIVALLVVAKN